MSLRMRPNHILKRKGKYEALHNVLVVDTEATIDEVGDEQYHSLRVGMMRKLTLSRKGRYERRCEWVFRTVDEFWGILDSLSASKKTYNIFAHNLNYDAMIFGFFTASARGYKVRKLIVSSQVFFAILTRDKTTFIFRDTTCYVKSSLAAFGKAIGLEKLEVDYKNVADEELLVYLKRDIDILEALVVNLLYFARDNDCGVLGLTAAQFAMNTFRYRFMVRDIYIHNDERALELEREAYYGGRTEAFRIGAIDGDVFQLDINSQYPYVMYTNRYPVKLLYVSDELSIPRAMKLLDEGFGIIAMCELTPGENAFPQRHEGKLIFPLWEYKGALCTPELRLALEKGYVKRILRAAIYEMDYIFRDYVDYFYRLRLEYKTNGNRPFELMTKLLLNSLYGKFGQKRPEWVVVNHTGYTSDTEIVEWIEVMPDSNEVVHYRQVLDKVYMKCGGGETYDSFPAIAAHVTAYARQYLWTLIVEAGRENTLYVDTDSLFVTRQGYENISGCIDKTRLGALKLEASGDGMTIYGLKDYTFCGHEKHKGIRSKARKISDNAFEQEQFCSALSNLKKGETARVIVHKQLKTLKREYDKGIIIDGVVYPFTDASASQAQAVHVQRVPPQSPA